MVNRRTNLITSRLGYFGTWNSRWVGDNLTYSDLVNQDFKVVSFLNGLFRKLHIPASKFDLTRYSFRVVTIESDLYVISPFWILYSHIDRVFERACGYYVGRMFFRVPLLLLRARAHTRAKFSRTSELRKAHHAMFGTLDSRFRIKRSKQYSSWIRAAKTHVVYKKIKCCLPEGALKNNSVASHKSSKRRVACYILSELSNQGGPQYFHDCKKKKNKTYSRAVLRRLVLDVGARAFVRTLNDMLLFNPLCAGTLIRSLRRAAMVVHTFFFGKRRMRIIKSKKYAHMSLRAFKNAFSRGGTPRENSRRFKLFALAVNILARLSFKISTARVCRFVKLRLMKRHTYSLFLTCSTAALRHSISNLRLASYFMPYSVCYSGVMPYLSSCFNAYYSSDVGASLDVACRYINRIDHRMRTLIGFVLRLRWHYQIVSLYYALTGLVYGLVSISRFIFCGSQDCSFDSALCNISLDVVGLLRRLKRMRSFSARSINVLGHLLNVSTFFIKSRSLSCRLAVRKYYANVSFLRRLRYWLQALGNIRIGRSILNTKTKTVRFLGKTHIRSYVRNMQSIPLLGMVHPFGSRRIRLSTLNKQKKRRFLRRLRLAHRLIHSLLSHRWFRLSVDKLIQNIEFTLSSYFNASVLFLPRIYRERSRRKFWAHRIVRHNFNKATRLVSRRRIVKRTNRSIRIRALHVKRREAFFYRERRALKKLRSFPMLPLLRGLRKHRPLTTKKFQTRRIAGINKLIIKGRRRRRFKRCIFLRSVSLRKTFPRLHKFRKGMAYAYRKRIRTLNSDIIEKKIEFVRRRKARTLPTMRNHHFLIKSRTCRNGLRLMKYGIHTEKQRHTSYGRNSKRRPIQEHRKFSSRIIRPAGPPTRSRFPPIKDAKLICDYIVYHLNRHVRLYRLFSNIRYWQTIEYRITNTLKYTAWIDSVAVMKKYPLSGIRILCSGSPKKGARKRRNHYHLWVRNQRLTRTMPLQEIETDIDYFSSNTNVTTGTVGVKVWLCFSTISYKYRSRDDTYLV